MDNDMLILTDDDTDFLTLLAKQQEVESNYMDTSSSPIDLENSHPSPLTSMPTCPIERPSCHSHRPRFKQPSKPSTLSSVSHRNRPNRITRERRRRSLPYSPNRVSSTYLIASTTDKGYTLTSSQVWRSRYQPFGHEEWAADLLNCMEYQLVDTIYVPNRITERRVMQVIRDPRVRVCLIPVPLHITADSRKMASYIAYLLNDSAMDRRRFPYQDTSYEQSFTFNNKREFN